MAAGETRLRSRLRDRGGAGSLAYAFGPAGLDEVMSFTTTTNKPSQRVMERIGMTHEETDDFDDPRLPIGHPLRRHVLYRITHAQWQA